MPSLENNFFSNSHPSADPLAISIYYYILYNSSNNNNNDYIYILYSDAVVYRRNIKEFSSSFSTEMLLLECVYKIVMGNFNNRIPSK